MGAFVLFEKHTEFDQDAVRSLMTERGFAEPVVMDFKTHDLWYYNKQAVDVDVTVSDEQGNRLLALGAVVYKGMGYRDGLTAILSDFVAGRLDQTRLIGSFVLIFHVDERLHLLTDRLNVQKVFSNEERTLFSSSFLALLVSSRSPRSINRMAFLEKVATGYVVGPDTLISGIECVSSLWGAMPPGKALQWVPLTPRGLDRLEMAGTRHDALDEQLSVLRRYMLDINPFVAEFKANLGLSSGYDSRLVLALSRWLYTPLRLHTHGTKGVHDIERRYAEELAALAGLDIDVVPTEPVADKNEQGLAAIMRDNLLCFDGRSTIDIGAFSETYTREYKIKTLGGCGIALNGMGGEHYRNYFATNRKHLHFPSWMRNNVYYPFAAQVLEREISLEDLDRFIIPKMERIMNTGLSGRVDLLTMRRYYSEIRMAEGDGIPNDVGNQYGFYLAPFLDAEVAKAAYRATPFIGATGTFQADLIARLDPALAAVGSHYGFPLSREPLKTKLFRGLKGMIPDKLLTLEKQARIHGLGLGRNNRDRFNALKQRSETLRGLEESLQSAFPNLAWSESHRRQDEGRNSLFLGSLLHHFSGHLTGLGG